MTSGKKLKDNDFIVLAVNASSEGCEVALRSGGRVVSALRSGRERGQAEDLVPMVRDCARDAGVPLSRIDLASAVTGPGSFTGIRIGLAAISGVSLATGCPMIGISAFDVIAASVPPASNPDAGALVVAVPNRDALPFLRIYARCDETGSWMPDVGWASKFAPPSSSDPGDAAICPWAGNRGYILAGPEAALDRKQQIGMEFGLDAVASQLCHVTCESLAMVAEMRRELSAQSVPCPEYLRAPEVTLRIV